MNQTAALSFCVMATLISGYVSQSGVECKGQQCNMKVLLARPWRVLMSQIMLSNVLACFKPKMHPYRLLGEVPVVL
jgi:hypothetical protein